jgi:hypothetical protein
MEPSPTNPPIQSSEPPAQPVESPQPFTIPAALEEQPITPSEQVPSDASTGSQPFQPQVISSSAATSPPPPKPGSKHKRRLVLLVIAVLLLVGGGSAAAYFTVILPNKPENKLGLALLNLTKQQQFSIKGTLDEKSKGTSNATGVSADFTLDADAAKSQLSGAGKLGVNGTQFPFDLRYIDKDIYLRVSGLDLIGKALSAYASIGAQASPYLGVLKNINNQWYVIDRSFVNQSQQASCVSDLSFTFSDADRKKIETAYRKYPLFSIKGSGAATVEGVATTKYEVEPASDEMFNKFTKELNSLSVVENANKCLKQQGSSDKLDTEVKPSTNEDEGTGTAFIYVTDDKQVKQIELTFDDKSSTSKVTLTMQNKQPTFEKPEGAKPIQDLLSAYLGLGGSSPTGLGL